METRIEFRRLFQKVKEGEYNYALIAYWKIPWVMEGEYVVEYKKRILINLYLFDLAFEWTDKKPLITKYKTDGN